MTDWLSLVVLVALAFVIHLIVWSVAVAGIRARARRDLASGQLILEYGWGAKAVALFLAAIPVVFTLGQTRGLTSFEGVNWGFLLFFFGIFMVFAGPGLIEFFGVSHRVTPQGIRKGSPWSRKFSVTWEEIQEITYSVSFDGFVLRTPHGKIRVSTYLSGLDDLLLSVFGQVPQKVWSKAEGHIIQRVAAGARVHVRLDVPSWEGARRANFEGRVRHALALEGGAHVLVVRADAPQEIHRDGPVIDVLLAGLGADVFLGLFGSVAQMRRDPIAVGMWRLKYGWLSGVDTAMELGGDPPGLPDSGYLGQGEIRLVGYPPSLRGD